MKALKGRSIGHGLHLWQIRHRSTRQIVNVLVIVLFMAPHLAAIHHNSSSEPVTPYHRFGYSVSQIGDLNGDGIPEVVVGAPYLDWVGPDRGRVYIFSGADLSLIKIINGEAANDLFGFSISSLADVNGDGVDELLVAAPGHDDHRGKVYVYSGLTFALLMSFSGEAVGDEFGYSVSRAGDLDSDGVEDIIIGAPGAENQRGWIYAYLGGVWILKFQDRGENEGDRLGHAVAAAGDFDDDGYDDVVIGAPGFDGHLLADTGKGRIYIISGTSALGNIELVCYRTGLTAGAQFGWSVAGGGDMNNDGKPDIIVGAPGEEDDRGMVYVYTYRGPVLGCELLISMPGITPGGRAGHYVSLGGDINGDGNPDAAVGAPYADGKRGEAYAILCENGTWDYRCYAQGGNENDQFGSAAIIVGDLGTSDGYDELAVGAVFADCTPPPLITKGNGRVYIYSGHDCTLMFERSPDLPTITITSPVAGETLCAGLPYPIDWDTTNAYLAPTIALSYYPSDADTPRLVGFIVNDGNYSWSVPCTTNPGDYFISLHTPSGDIADTSGLFSIVRSDLKITSPEDGTTLEGCSTVIIEWEDSRCGSSYSFVIKRYLLDGGLPWSPWEYGIPNTGQYEWDVPNVDTDTCLFVLGISGGCVCDTVSLKIRDVCFCGEPFGDLNCDGTLDPVDISYIVNYVYRSQDQRCYPPCWNCLYPLGDVNCDKSVDPLDVVYYVNCIYKGLCDFCDPCDGFPNHEK